MTVLRLCGGSQHYALQDSRASPTLKINIVRRNCAGTCLEEDEFVGARRDSSITAHLSI